MTTTINASTSAGLVQTADTSGILQLQTANTAAMTIDASQNVGIGAAPASEWTSSSLLQVTSPTSYSTISLASTRTVSSGNRIGSIVWDMPNNTATYKTRAEIECDMIGSTSGKFGAAFRLNTALDNATSLTTGAVVNPYGIGVGNTTPSSGTGIAFPATQNPSSDANCLDDYEEGTWTPTLLGGSSNPTVSYSNTAGQYTKIGNTVIARGRLQTTSVSGGSGGAQIGGLPFAIGNNGISNIGCSGISFFSNINLTSTFTQLGLYINSTGVSFVNIAASGTNLGATGLNVSSMGNTTDISFVITYQI